MPAPVVAPEPPQDLIDELVQQQAPEDVLATLAPPPEVTTAPTVEPEPVKPLTTDVQELIDQITQAPEDQSQQSIEELFNQIAPPPSVEAPPIEAPAEEAPPAPLESKDLGVAPEEPLPDYTQDLPPEEQPIETKQLTDEDIANMPGYGNLEQDYAVTDTGKILDTSTGQTGIFDESGVWSPDYDIGSLADLGNLDQSVGVTGTKDEQAAQDALDLLTGGTGDVFFDDTLDRLTDGVTNTSAAVDTGEETTDSKTGTGSGKTTTGGTNTGKAKSGDDDLLTLLALMGLMPEDAGIPIQQLADVRGKSVSDIFSDYFA